ncbi:MAG: hypothetical protein WAK28_02055 [Trebonia sp.]
MQAATSPRRSSTGWIWYHTDLPPPVGISTSASLPPIKWPMMISSCWSRKLS